MLHFLFSALLEDQEGNRTRGLSAEHPQQRVHVADLRWQSTSAPFIYVSWLFLACIAKLLFTRSTSLTKLFPDSSLLIALGLAIGALLEQSQVSKAHFTLESHLFFLYLLPSIIFEAGYFMPNRAFFKNWDSILMFSVVGTLFNALAIGFSLYFLSGFFTFAHEFTIFEILQFSSLISAVDPVAVIAVFEEIHVNDFIFVNIFGEALFNDGVTVVLFNLFKQFSWLDEPQAVDYVAGTASFFVVSIGGLVVGLCAAFLTAILTKIAVCGMVMKQYIKGNVTASAAASIKYLTKMMSSSSEAVIFLFLGLSAMAKSDIQWDTAFVTLTILLCVVVRTLGVIIQCALLNRFRGKTFSMVDQFILSYGGLRGAIAFGLASSISSSVPAKDMFLTTTIAVICFTVFLQGSTIRPLVNYLKVETKSPDDPTMTEAVCSKYLDYMIAGIEGIAGQKGHASVVHGFERFNNNVLCPILMKNHSKTRNFDATKIVRAYSKLTLRDAMGLSSKWQNNKVAAAAISSNDIAWAQKHCACSSSSGHEPSCPLSQPHMAALFDIFSNMLDKRMKEMQDVLASQHGDEGFCDDYNAQAHRVGSSSVEPHAATDAVKECGALAPWDKTACESSGPTTCQAPATSSATQFACAAGFAPVLKAPTTSAMPLNSITCDTGKGEWTLENSRGENKTPKELEAVIPGPYKFFCAQ